MDKGQGRSYRFLVTVTSATADTFLPSHGLILVFTGEKHPEFELSDIGEMNSTKNVWEMNQVVGSEQKKIGHTALFLSSWRGGASLPTRRRVRSASSLSARRHDAHCRRKTGRVCYGMELDPGYRDVIVSRYVNLTGGAVILNGKKVKWKTDG